MCRSPLRSSRIISWLVVAACFCLSAASEAIAADVVPFAVTTESKLTASDGGAGDNFGYQVAVSGNTAVVGAAYADVGGNLDQGAAYVYVRDPATGVWSEQAKLVAADGVAGDYFGFSVFVDGDTALVGAVFADINGALNQGAAYVFVRDRATNTWSQQAKLVAADGAAYNKFGFSVALAGDTAVIGSQFATIGLNYNQGAAYVFQRSNGSWSEQAKLTASDGLAFDYFGTSVSISGDTAVVGAEGVDINGSASGAAYVFRRTASVWSQEGKFVAGDGLANDYFGSSVSISGDTVVVGARGSDPVVLNQGAAYVFQRSGSVWSLQQKLWAADGVSSDAFGYSVAISGDLIAAGANGVSVGFPRQGAVYLFQRSGSVWNQQGKLTASDGGGGDSLGASVSISGDTVVAGANLADISTSVDQGAAYAWDLALVPTVSIGLNQFAFATGNNMTLTAVTEPAGPPSVVDVWVVLTLPNGSKRFLRMNGSLGTTPAPILSNWTVAPFNGAIFTGTFSGIEPVGNYQWQAGFTSPGTLNFIEPLSTVPFSFAP